MKTVYLRICSLLLTLAILVNLMPVNALATEKISEELPSSNLSTQEGSAEESYVLDEVIENRTQFSKEYRLNNGMYMMMLYPEAVHYEKDGQWEDIDNTLKLAQTRSGNTYTNTAGIWQISFPQSLTASSPITITKDSHVLSFRMGGELHHIDEKVEPMEDSAITEQETTPEVETLPLPDATEAAENIPQTEEPAPEAAGEPAWDSSESTEDTSVITEPMGAEVQPSVSDSNIDTEPSDESTPPENLDEKQDATTSKNEGTTETDGAEIQEINPVMDESTVPIDQEITEPVNKTDNLVFETEHEADIPAETEAVPVAPKEDTSDLTDSVTDPVTIPNDETSAILGALSADTDLSLSRPTESSAAIVASDAALLISEDDSGAPVLEKLYSKLGYTDVYANTDIFFELGSNQVKESVVINQYDVSLYGYTYLLNVGNMTPVLTDSGEVELYSANGALIMIMPAPYLVDNAGEYNFDVEVQLAFSKGNYVLTYLLPQNWLADDSREWPVILDPAVQSIADSSKTVDQTVYEYASSVHTSGVMNCGYEPHCGKMRAYLKYMELPNLDSSDVVIDASIQLYACRKDGSSPAVVEVCEVLEDWKVEEISWSDQPNYGDIEDYAVCSGVSWLEWDITEIVRGWYDDDNSNNGICFKVSNDIEDAGTYNWMRFYSANFETACQPTLIITFRDNNGLENYWDYTTSSAGRAGTGYVNNYSGHLVWVRDEMGFGGNRMPVSISRIYNANDCESNEFGMGYGWRTNYNQLVYHYDMPDSLLDYYVWEDADGTSHYFMKKDATTYVDEDGVELTLKITDSGYCISDKYGNCSTFDSGGRLIKLENNQKTKSNITITYTNSIDNYIKEIIDGAGRKYAFTYYGSNTLSRISYLGTGTTELAYMQYAYHNLMLTTATYMDGGKTHYSYTSNNHLNVVQDVDGYKITYTYNQIIPDRPSRVRFITESDGTTTGGSLKIEYGQNQTTFTDAEGNVQIHQFNNCGNTISVQDDQGRAQYAGYAINDPSDTDEITATDESARGNQLRLSSKLQNTVGNVLNDISFENSTPWSVTSSAVSRSIATGTAYIGTNSLKMTRSTAGAEAGVSSASTAVSPGETYTFSAYVKTGNSPAYLGIYDGTKTVRSEVLAAGSDWTRLEVSYTAESSVSIIARLLTEGAGTTYMDCVQLEKAEAASRYNIVQNGDFRHFTFWSARTGRTTLTENGAPAYELDMNVYKLSGSPTATNRLSQTIQLSGSKDDGFVLAGWAMGNSAPLDTTGSTQRQFSIIATFTYTDGTTESTTVQFNPYVENWQYVAAGFAAKKAYSAITVALAYDYNVNTAYFDGIQLYREEFGTQYTYDENGNVESATDVEGHTTEYKYDANNNLKTITEHIGNTSIITSYTYDQWHNVKTATTDSGVVYSFDYDKYGNNEKVTIGSGDYAIITSAKYSDDGNRLLSTTDAAGKTTTYDYDVNTNQLISVKYPNDNPDTKTTYDYDEETFRLTSVRKPIDTTTALTATYTYSETDDTLLRIATGSTTYSFEYGAFDLRSAVKIGSRTLASYTYTDRTNYLSTLDYGNGHGVDYSYDKQGRLTQQKYTNGSTTISTVDYRYDNDGGLAAVKDSATGITTKYYYDFTNRLRRYTETSDTLSHTVDYIYNDRGNLAQKNETLFGQSWKVFYTYDDDNRMISSAQGTSSRTISYDNKGRLSGTVLKRDGANALTTNYAYNSGTTQVSTITMTSLDGTVSKLKYSYDNNGNISAVRTEAPTGNYNTGYSYDTANQLVRENNQQSGLTTVWTYDNAGNITSRKEYIYTTGTPTELMDTVNYTYGDSQWGDLLTAYDGQTITYDKIGNPTSYYNGKQWNMTWTRGRQLETISDGTTTWTNTYSSDGLRTSRTDGTTTYTYVYDGDRLTGIQRNDLNMYIIYDANGPATIKYGSGTFHYVTNQQGDVIAIVGSNGERVVEYTYDAWGNVLSITGTFDYNLGIHNPILYRGYIYDHETGLYYCQSRYYDPKVGRFINADALVSTGQGLLGNNMFAYCNNNPVCYSDPDGYRQIPTAKGFEARTLDPEGYSPWQPPLRIPNARPVKTWREVAEVTVEFGIEVAQSDGFQDGASLPKIATGVRGMMQAGASLLTPDIVPLFDEIKDVSKLIYSFTKVVIGIGELFDWESE